MVCRTIRTRPGELCGGIIRQLRTSFHQFLERLECPPERKARAFGENTLTRDDATRRRRGRVDASIFRLRRLVLGVPPLALLEQAPTLLNDALERSAASRTGQAGVVVRGNLASKVARRVLARALDKRARQDERPLVVQLRGRRRFGRADLLLKARLYIGDRRVGSAIAEKPLGQGQKTYLGEVRILNHDEGLDRNKDLKYGTPSAAPVLVEVHAHTWLSKLTALLPRRGKRQNSPRSCPRSKSPAN